MLFSVVNNPAISANELNHNLKVISQWAYQWKMNLINNNNNNNNGLTTASVKYQTY